MDLTKRFTSVSARRCWWRSLQHPSPHPRRGTNRQYTSNTRRESPGERSSIRQGVASARRCALTSALRPNQYSITSYLTCSVFFSVKLSRCVVVVRSSGNCSSIQGKYYRYITITSRCYVSHDPPLLLLLIARVQQDSTAGRNAALWQHRHK